MSSSLFRFGGIIPPVITPTTARDIDVPGLRRHIGILLEVGVHGLFVLGSSGEVPYLNDARRFTGSL